MDTKEFQILIAPFAGLNLSQSRIAIQGLSVRKATEFANIHKKTSFHWRHRLLTAPGNVRDVEIEGIVEAKETYFLQSFKGSRQMPRKARKRGGKTKKRGLSEE